MRKIRYGVAMSLDGYIAGQKGEADWIVSDREVNFAERYRPVLDRLQLSEKALIP
jgi:riboflavin biosynthesis pyrimidine reductase